MNNPSDLVGKSKGLLKLVDYQEGAVVSREITRKGAGTVTIFAFDKGQGLSEHTAPFEALVYIADGAAEIRIGDKTQKVASGEIIILPANTPHALDAAERFKMLLIMLKSD